MPAACAEKLDVPDASYDAVVSIYLFHELPAPVRKQAVAEFFRVLKPGGARACDSAWEARVGSADSALFPYFTCTCIGCIF